jgi:hypothetical protein
MRVLNPTGVLIVGRTVAPEDGIDARMKRRLAELLDAMGVESRRTKQTEVAARWLEREWCELRIASAATWTSERTPRAFVERRATGAQFSVLPAPVKDIAMLRLREWAVGAFGSLDAVFVEPFRFDLMIGRFQAGMSH